MMRFVAAVVAAIALANAASAEAAVTCEQIGVAMPDGAKLHGWLRADKDVGKRPVLWIMTPYQNDGGCPAEIAGIDAATAAKFNVVRLSYRGTGASEGVTDHWGPQTRKDVLDVGNWITTQPWAGGLVPTGASAEGAWITYALEHPKVVASVWLTSCADPLRGCIRNGGQLAGGMFLLSAGLVQGYGHGVPQRVENGHATNPTPVEQWTGQAELVSHAYTDDTTTDFWKERLGLHHLKRIHAPVMYTTDLYDFVPEGMYVAYEHTLPRYRWLNLGLGHNSPVAIYGDTKLRELVHRPVRRFLERFALRERNGFEKDPRVTLVTNTGTPSGYRRGEVLVRPEPAWPLPSTKWTRLHLGAGGTLSRKADQGTDTSALATVTSPKAELRTSMVATGAGPLELGDNVRKVTHDDLRAEEAIGLTYTTAPLTKPVEISGPIVLRVVAAATAKNFDWQVRLTDVHADGKSAWITDGQLRASLRAVDPKRSRRNRAGDITRPWYTFERHEDVPAGEDVEYLIELGPTSNVFEAGHRIRLDIQPIATGYLDSVRTAGVGVLNVRRDRSSVLLPLIPHRCGRSVAAVDGIGPPKDCAGAIG